MSPDQARSKERKYLTTFVRRLEKVLEKLIDERGWGGVEVLRELCELTSLTPADVSPPTTVGPVQPGEGWAARS